MSNHWTIDRLQSCTHYHEIPHKETAVKYPTRKQPWNTPQGNSFKQDRCSAVLLWFDVTVKMTLQWILKHKLYKMKNIITWVLILKLSNTNYMNKSNTILCSSTVYTAVYFVIQIVSKHKKYIQVLHRKSSLHCTIF